MFSLRINFDLEFRFPGETHASAESALIGGSGAARGIVEQRLRGTPGGGRLIGVIPAYASLDDASLRKPVTASLIGQPVST